MIGTPGANPVVVLSYDFWKTQLASAPDVVGRKVLVNQHPMTVIGVAAPAFRGIDVGEVPSLWIPAAMSAQAIPGFDRLIRPPHAMDAGAGPPQAGRYGGAGSGGLQPWFKAMLDEDTRRAGFPRITAERRQRFLASTLELTPAPQGHSSSAAQAVAAALGLVRGNGGVVGSGLPECRRSLPGARIGSRP